MVADTWLLMQLYWRLDRREVTSQSKLRILAYVLGVIGMLFIGAFSAAVGYFSSFLLRPEIPVRVPPGLIPGLILTFVLLGVLITGLNQAVKSLFLSGDLDRLMVAPVHTRSVMVAKLLSRLPSSLLLLLLIAAPALVAYGIGIGAGPVYYLVGAVLLLLAPLFGLSVGAVIAMLLVRVLPVNRVSELLAAAYAFLGIGIALLFQLPRLFITDNPEEMASSISGDSLSTFVETMDRLPIPTLWAGRGLVALDMGSVDATGLLGILAYVLTTLGLFTLIILTADRLYLSGWLKTQSAGGKRRGLETGGGRLGRGSLAAAIGWKDWLMRLRDPRQLVNTLGSGVIAIVVGGLALFRGSGSDTSLMAASQSGLIEAPGGWTALTAAFSPGVLMAAWALFTGYVFLSSPATYALAQEGGAFAMLKAAPIRPRDVWRAKTWSVMWPYIALFIIVLIVSRFFVSYSLLWLPYALAAGLLMGYGLMALNVSVGFRYANLAWTDPRRMTTSGGGWVSLVLSVAYGLPAGIVTILGFGLSAVWPQWSLLFAAVALALLALYTWLWHVLMSRWAESAWDKLPV
jgi:ABC-2 type transport system permease protein